MPGTQTAWTTAAIQNQWFWRAAVQIVYSSRRRARDIEHIGSGGELDLGLERTAPAAAACRVGA
jgi:hypothetical protein